MWHYIGPHLDPHRHVYVAGMLRQVNADAILHQMDGLLPPEAEPMVADFYSLAGAAGAGHQVLVFKYDGAACGFGCRGTQFADGPAMLAAALQVFPQIADRLKGLTCEAPTSEPALSEASASDAATTAPESKPGKPSSKSNA